MVKIGDMVSVLDEPVRGRVNAIDGDKVTIVTDDGFDIIFQLHEVVLEKSDTSIIPTYDQVHENLQEKEIFKKKSKKPKIKFKKKEIPPMEVDLHIHKLVKSVKGMTNHDMVTLQLETAKRQLDFAISKKIPKIIFIHGVGQGVLKEELKYLFRRYDNVNIADADYRKYGVGAMELYIVQNPKIR